MDESVELTGNQKAWLRLEAMSVVLARARELELAKIGLSRAQTQVLYCLSISPGPTTPMKLARMMHKQPHTISVLVHRMETHGLLTTKRDMKRKNWVRVSLTKNGEETLKHWATATMVPDALSCLSKKEAEALYTITKKLHNGGVELLQQMQPDPYSEPLFW